MSERVLSEGRPQDTSVTTATLAAADERFRQEANAGLIEAESDAPGRTVLKSPAATAATEKSNAINEQNAPLFPSQEATDLHARWDAIQVAFVDEPRRAVEQADALVAAAMKRMAEIFSQERSRLEGQWDRGDSVNTEDLRLALRRYRSFFGRVLAV